MKPVIRWAIKNTPAMNVLLIAILVLGGLASMRVNRETFPEFALEMVLVEIPYPGATPGEVEEALLLAVEGAIEGIQDVKKTSSVAREGGGFLILELDPNVPNVDTVVNEVESAINRVPAIQNLREQRPTVQQVTFSSSAIRLGILGPNDDSTRAKLALREITENLRDDLLASKKNVTLADIEGAVPYQIDVEIPEQALREYGLTLKGLAQRIRAENTELPSGSIRSSAGTVNTRGAGKREVGPEIAKIPLITDEVGTKITIGDIGRVRDEFSDDTFISRINGVPGLSIAVKKTKNQDLIALAKDVREFAKERESTLPAGYKLIVWGDTSVDVQDRLSMLLENGIQGLLLVFLVLAVFLDLRLAFWVALGIPMTILGACGYMEIAGETMNMLTMFAFLMTIGIIVDDAIIIGENIYAHQELGKDPSEAAVEGTAEVLPSVTTAVTTTIIAFAPLLFVSGVMGKFMEVMPMVVIIMLLLSLVESAFILPCHLAHKENLVFRVMRYTMFYLLPLVWIVQRVNKTSSHVLQWFIKNLYSPLLRISLNHPYVTALIGVCVLVLLSSAIQAGVVKFVLMPKLDENNVQASLLFRDGTPASYTDEKTAWIEEKLLEINEEYKKNHGGQELIKMYSRVVGTIVDEGGGPMAGSSGSNSGQILVELVGPENRTIHSEKFLEMWRDRVGEIAGAEMLDYGSSGMGPGGEAIEFRVLADAKNMDSLEAAVEECKDFLKGYEGVIDIRDDSNPGKWELRYKLKDTASAMGVTEADLAETIRATYYGEEVEWIQRGRHELKLMVRYPKEERESYHGFEQIRVRANDGIERPITELADIDLARGYTSINRINQKRSITVTASVEEGKANAQLIADELNDILAPKLLEKHPGISFLWEGQQAETEESVNSMVVGFLIAVCIMYGLLTLEFTSYIQPLLILCIVPFGLIGAVIGHWFLGMDMTLFSMFGLVALTGIVVNDSIVLIDFINKLLDRGIPLKRAIYEAGCRRFRPVFLTSLTTVAGLFPMLLERSLQAQVLIPMAASIFFGLMFSTVLVLIMVPVIFLIYGQALLPGRPIEVDSGADSQIVELIE